MTRRTRILLTLDAAGGVWRYAMDLAAGSPELEMVFLGFGPRPAAAEREEAERLGVLDWSDEPLDWTVPEAADLARVPGVIAGAAARRRADLIHLGGATQAAGLDTPLPVVVTSHSCVATWFHAVKGCAPPATWAWQHEMTRAGLRRADALIAPSEAHAGLLREVYGALPITVVHNAVGDLASGEGDRPIVAAAGRWWDAGKNGAVLDAAAPLMDWPVTMLGPLVSPTGERFEPRHARATGALAHDAAMAVIRDAGIFAAPSLYEPFGLAVAEAASAATPLVLADIPTFRELWGEAALFFPPTDRAALARAVNRLAGDPDLRRRLGAAARARARHFSRAAQARAMRGIYAGLTESAAVPALEPARG